MIKTLICIDRDGTLIHDEKEHLYLGRDNEWKAKVRILPYVIDGIKALNRIPGSAIYMITNQPGVAISEFPLLTVERAHEVCRYVISEIKGLGGRIDGYSLCPHADRSYLESHLKYHFDEQLVCDCDCIKPGLGMVFDALKAEGVTRQNVNVFVIGDRVTDVQTALNIGGTGIFVPFENEQGQEDNVKKIADQSRIYIARNMLDAAEFISQSHH
ncbi:MAG: hypothetical protein HY808_14070 [Nitrospirae bacterium]|nr:hypothetical protein [Nitrospirota bacterium]